MPRGKSKKEQMWYDDAKFHFIYLSYTFDDLERKFPVANKTLRTWAQKGQWLDEKNKSFRNRMAIRSELEEFCVSELRALRELRQKDPGAEVSQSRFYTVMRMVDTAMKVFDYGKKVEEDAREDDKDHAPKGKLSEDTLRMIENDLRLV